MCHLAVVYLEDRRDVVAPGHMRVVGSQKLFKEGLVCKVNDNTEIVVEVRLSRRARRAVTFGYHTRVELRGAGGSLDQ